MERYIVGRLWESEGSVKTTWSDTSLVGFGRVRTLVRLHGVIHRWSALGEQGLWYDYME